MRSVGESFKMFVPFPISALRYVDKIKQLLLPLGILSSLLVLFPESV